VFLAHAAVTTRKKGQQVAQRKLEQTDATFSFLQKVLQKVVKNQVLDMGERRPVTNLNDPTLLRPHTVVV
jgi:hypothetical protein